MARKEIALKKILFVCDYDPAHYDWNSQEQTALGDAKATAKVILSRLKAHKVRVARMYAIEHNADTQNFFWASERYLKEAAFKEYQQPVRAHTHIHVLIFFEDDSKIERSKVAEILGVSKYTIDKIHTEDGCLAYLCHCKYEKKYQYPKTAVHTLAGKDFVKIYDENYERWFNSREKVSLTPSKKEEKKNRNIIYEKYESGELSYEEIFASEEYYPIVSQPNNKRWLDKKVKTLREIDRTNSQTLTKIIEEKMLISLEETAVSYPLYLTYRRNLKDNCEYKTNFDALFESNFIKLLSTNQITFTDILKNEAYCSFYKSHKQQILGRCGDHLISMVRDGEIKNIKEIYENEIMLDIFNNSYNCKNVINDLLQ